MEDKLDKLSEAVVEIAWMEDHLLTIFKRLEHMDSTFKKYDYRVDEIESKPWSEGKNSIFWRSILDGRHLRRWPRICIFEVFGGGQTSSYVSSKEI